MKPGQKPTATAVAVVAGVFKIVRPKNQVEHGSEVLRLRKMTGTGSDFHGTKELPAQWNNSGNRELADPAADRERVKNAPGAMRASKTEARVRGAIPASRLQSALQVHSIYATMKGLKDLEESANEGRKKYRRHLPLYSEI